MYEMVLYLMTLELIRQVTIKISQHWFKLIFMFGVGETKNKYGLRLMV